MNGSEIRSPLKALYIKKNPSKTIASRSREYSGSIRFHREPNPAETSAPASAPTSASHATIYRK